MSLQQSSAEGQNLRWGHLLCTVANIRSCIDEKVRRYVRVARSQWAFLVLRPGIP